MSNYRTDLTTIISRPYMVGNTITVKSGSGVVEEIGLAATHLSNKGGGKITIPIKHIVGEILTN